MVDRNALDDIRIRDPYSSTSNVPPNDLVNVCSCHHRERALGPLPGSVDVRNVVAVRRPRTYRAVMRSRSLAVTFDAHDPTALARFWAGVLAREIVEDAGTARLPGKEAQLGLSFTPTNSDRVGLNRIHLHLTSSSPEYQQQTVATALGLGARHFDVGQRPEEGHVVLADPAGNEFCVLGPDNTFVEGCGLLGELACDGTREVGLFWSEALGWPLVWDENQETAIQSPHGGTKIAWGGPPVAPKLGRSQQRLELSTADGNHAETAERLVALGATHLRVCEHGVIELADPDGNEFSITSGRPNE